MVNNTKDSFIVLGEHGVKYTIHKNLSVIREDGHRVKMIRKGTAYGIQQGWTINKKKSSKFHPLNYLYADHFVPNPDNLRYPDLIDHERGVVEGNIKWVAKRERREPIKFTLLDVERERELEKEKVVKERKRVKTLHIPTESIIKPLDKYFLRKEDHDLAILHDKPKPRLDANFKRI